MEVGQFTLTKSRTDRVIFLVETPPSGRDVERFGVGHLKGAGLTVEFWDLSAVVLPDSRQQWIRDTSDVAVWTHRDKAEVERALRKLDSSDLLISLVGTDRSQWRSHQWIQQAWSASNARLGAVSATRTLGTSVASTDSSRLRSVLTSPLRGLLNGSGYISQVLQEYLRRRYAIRALDFAWVGSRRHDLNQTLIGVTTQVSVLHSLDYDLVLEEKARERDQRPVGVLLDTMGPSHPDFVTFGKSYWSNTPEEYFHTLRTLLADLETSLGMPIEVAAHPRAAPGSLDAFYVGHQVRYGETARALAESRIVIATNATTSLGMAIALDKPLLLVCDPDWPNEVKSGITKFARLTDAQVWTRSSSPPPCVVRGLGTKQRENFLSEFVKSPTCPDKPFWELVADEITGRRLSEYN